LQLLVKCWHCLAARSPQAEAPCSGTTATNMHIDKYMYKRMFLGWN
jgi:hypothetical protein